ncbi:MAG: hypothetical protein KGL39_50365, partial [Patescibacteria group bacterium]|nr:hypothetical protein [Patescibacteria group bacterium]
MKITYAKLKNGEWGVRVEGCDDPRRLVGQIVQVSKRNGETKEERIKALVWDKDEIALCKIEGRTVMRPQEETPFD